MKPGDLVRRDTNTNHYRSNSLIEGDMSKQDAITRSDANFYRDELALVLETYHEIGNHIYHKIMTPRGRIGWIHELELEVFSEAR
jgi:hypothetical protein